MDGVAGEDVEIEHEESHGHGNDAVTQGGEALDALSGNTVVQRVHRKGVWLVAGTRAKTCSRLQEKAAEQRKGCGAWGYVTSGAESAHWRCCVYV